MQPFSAREVRQKNYFLAVLALIFNLLALILARFLLIRFL